jgi:hypothetical protein
VTEPRLWDDSERVEAYNCRAAATLARRLGGVEFADELEAQAEEHDRAADQAGEPSFDDMSWSPERSSAPPHARARRWNPPGDSPVVALAKRVD